MLKTVAPSPTASHLLEWAAPTMTPGLAPTRARKLAERFGSADAVFRASLTELESAGIQVVSAQALATGKSAELAREEIARVAAAKRDPGFVRRCGLSSAAQGDLRSAVGSLRTWNAEVLTRPGIAMVGTRHPTPDGLGIAERLACDLARHGLLIIRGMARGVDTASHRGAIAAKGKTVAVFETGVNVVYPRKIRGARGRFSPWAGR